MKLCTRAYVISRTGFRGRYYMEAVAATKVPSGERELPFSRRISALVGSSALRRALLFGAIAGAMVGALAATGARSMYSSTGQLAGVPIEDPTHPGNSLEGAAAALPMLAAVMQTGPAADQVVEALGLARVYGTRSVVESRAAFWKNVSVLSDRRSGIVKVTAEDPDAKRAR